MPVVDFKLYLITDRKQMKLPLPDAVHLALKGGARAIQLREKDLSIRDLLAVAQDLRNLTHQFGAKLFINDRVDVAVAVDADGVHLGQNSMPPEAARTILGKDMLVGVSAHSIAEAIAAGAGGADFITFGPVFHTPSKESFGEPVGLEILRSVKRSVELPVFALGGIKTEHIKQVLDHGADGISMISAVFKAEDIELAAASIISELRCL